MSKRIVILGTGTGIGKTHAAVSLVAALAQRGAVVAGLKPIESGAEYARSDRALLSEVSSYPPEPAPYVFADPVSPHLAARRAGTPIRLEAITTWVASHTADVLLIETAGALLSPLGDGITNLNLAQQLAPQAVLLVAPDRLGVLHDVTACYVALKALAPELPRAAVLLQPPAEPDASTGTNAAELTRLQIAEVLTCFSRGEPTSPENIAAAGRVIDILLPTPCFT